MVLRLLVLVLVLLVVAAALPPARLSCSTRAPRAHQVNVQSQSKAIALALDGLNRQVFDKYDAFLVDQWGVLHDGQRPYSGVMDALEELSRQKKELVLLSNSSKRGGNGLAKAGIDAAKFFKNRIVTSGDVGYTLLSTPGRLRSVFTSLESDVKLRVFVFGNGEDDETYVAACGHQFVSSPEDADFVLARGTFSIGKKRFETAEENMNHVGAALALCELKKLPMLVTNPDFTRPGSGSPMPGAIAKMYTAMAPTCVIHQIGKPYNAVFEVGMSMLPPGTRRDRVCMVGDSLSHDILGARLFGIDSIFISNGVHSPELGATEGSSKLPDGALLEALLAQHLPYSPTYIIPSFRLF